MFIIRRLGKQSKGGSFGKESVALFREKHTPITRWVIFVILFGETVTAHKDFEDCLNFKTLRVAIGKRLEVQKLLWGGLHSLETYLHCREDEKRF